MTRDAEQLARRVAELERERAELRRRLLAMVWPVANLVRTAPDGRRAAGELRRALLAAIDGEGAP